MPLVAGSQICIGDASCRGRVSINNHICSPLLWPIHELVAPPSAGPEDSPGTYIWVNEEDHFRFFARQEGCASRL